MNNIAVFNKVCVHVPLFLFQIIQQDYEMFALCSPAPSIDVSYQCLVAIRLCSLG
jgi:hypothetical protein